MTKKKAATKKKPWHQEGLNTAEQAALWVKHNPKIYALFAKFAKQMMAMDRRFGARFLAERVRWEAYFLRSFDDRLVINNNYIPYIARKLCEDIPGLSKYLNFRNKKQGDH